MKKDFTFSADSFTPNLIFRNSHTQTLLGRIFRDRKRIRYHRVRIDTPDGDFLDLDFAEPTQNPASSLENTSPIFLLLHGLEGSARAVYAEEFYSAAAAQGWRCIGMNFRTCSGEMNQTPRFYHMCASDDVGVVQSWLHNQYPEAPILITGVSLGGNILLKYLGEKKDLLSKKLLAAAALSPPFVATGKQPLNDYWIGRLYGAYLLRKLRKKVKAKATMILDMGIDPEPGILARTLRKFDDAITAPLHGFQDADDYYQKCNSINFLPSIRTPTLLIRALDDPFFNPDIPYREIEANEYLYGIFPEHGGHVGFIEGLPPFRYHNWACHQVIRFLAQHVPPSED